MKIKSSFGKQDCRQFIINLKRNEKIEVPEFALPLSINKSLDQRAKQMQFESSFLKGLEIANGFKIEWTASIPNDPDVIGRVKILPLEEIIQAWEDVVYFDDTPEDDPIRNFYPVDFFVDEACVGIYAGPDQTTSLYLYEFEGTPYRLDLDMEGYLEMLFLAKGFLYWQDAIREIRSGKENPQSARFKKHMPQLFDDFNYEEFVKTYERLRLSKN